MNNTTISKSSTRNVTTFFVLTFALSTPFYILANFVSEMENVASLLIVFVPMTSALILTFRENGPEGAKELIKRAFDFKKITRIIWYMPILFIAPVIYLAVNWILRLIGDAPPESMFPLVMAPVLLLMFFIMAIGEELGWIGYAYDPMEERWNAFGASLILGIIWFTWHVPIYIFIGGRPLLWAAGQLVFMVGFRVLLSWIYNNTGKSFFAVILCHAVYNVAVTVLPGFERPLGPGISAVLLMIIVVTLIWVWDHQTLTELRRKPEFT